MSTKYRRQCCMCGATEEDGEIRFIDDDDLCDLCSKVDIIVATSERMLAERKSWQQIGDAIGWAPEAAKREYERQKQTEGGK